jgi:hypothetical protein
MTKAKPKEAPIPMRAKLLERALKTTCGDRDAQYGPPYINLGCAGLLKRVVHDQLSWSSLPPAVQEAIDQVLTKVARAVTGMLTNPDTFIDMAAYSAIAGESYNYYHGEDGR